MKHIRRRALVLVLVMVAVHGTVLFGSAGRLDLPMFWAVLLVWLAAVVCTVLWCSTDLLSERMTPGPGAKEKWVRPALLVLYLGHLATAGLDVGRLHVSDTVPLPLQLAGLAGFAAILAFTLWAQHVNGFFSSVVRVQSARGQHVVTHGPYRWIRHPGYAGFLWTPICTGLALGSWMSLSFFPAIAAVFVIRTIIEDRALRAELDGYEAYARTVRRRLLPGVW